MECDDSPPSRAFSKRLLRYWQMPVAMLLALFFASGLLSHSGWFSDVCRLLLFTGFLLNALVIAANGGYMPVAANLEGAPETSSDQYRPVDATTRFRVLGDWISVGPWLISPGDVLLVLGLVGGIAGRILGTG